MSDTLKFLYRQFFVIPPKASPQKNSLRGQTGIVTGSNIGLGLEASRQLLELGLSHLILAVRDRTKGANARAQLAQGAPQAKIEVWDLNLSNYASISAFTQKCATLSRLDFAILNAGILKTSMEINQSTGHEEVLQVNYLSTALLALQLLPILKNKSTGSKPSTLTMVGSETAEWAAFKEKDETPILAAFNDPKYFDLQDRYYTSKLMEEFFLVQLCHSLPNPSKVIVNVVNPGFCYGSGLHTEVTGALGVVFGIYKRLIGRSTSVGARTLVNAAVVQGRSSHGQYLSDCAPYKYVHARFD